MALMVKIYAYEESGLDGGVVNWSTKAPHEVFNDRNYGLRTWNDSGMKCLGYIELKPVGEQERASCGNCLLGIRENRRKSVMTHQTLKQRADEIAELDKKRTQGEWVNEYTEWFADTREYKDNICVAGNYICISSVRGFYRINDEEFAMAAPRMAQLIREQQERIEALEEDLSDAVLAAERLGQNNERISLEEVKKQLEEPDNAG